MVGGAVQRDGPSHWPPGLLDSPSSLGTGSCPLPSSSLPPRSPWSCEQDFTTREGRTFLKQNLLSLHQSLPFLTTLSLFSPSPNFPVTHSLSFSAAFAAMAI